MLKTIEVNHPLTDTVLASKLQAQKSPIAQKYPSQTLGGGS
jgi:hypothetical protein